MMTDEKIGLTEGLCGELLIKYQFISDDTIAKFVSSIENGIDSVDTLNFYDGLLGIFWTLVSVQDSIPLTCNILHKIRSFDDFIYKSVVNFIPNDLSLDNGIIGKGLYLYQRLKSESEPNYYRRTLIREALVLVAQEITKLILLKYKSNYLGQKQIYELAQAMCFLNSIKCVDIHPLITDDTIEYINRRIEMSSISIHINQPFYNLFIYLSNKTNIYNLSMSHQMRDAEYDMTRYSIQRARLIETLTKQNKEFWLFL